MTQSAANWAFRVPNTTDEGLAEFQRRVREFQQGRINETQFRAYRVPMGVYEQRESGTYMLRVRLPAGSMSPSQMKGLASVASSCGSSVLHVTTRQDIQVHRVPLQAIHAALVSLSESGLSTQGGGGNTVRNITGCAVAGVCADEIFDVRPYAIALTERLLEDPLSLQLPRKYKIAFSGCAADCPGAMFNDLGFVAKEHDGVRGFAVYVGGGLGTKSQVGTLLHEFVSAADTGLIAEAVKRVFDKHGDRKNKNRARLRFLVQQLGFERFRELYDREVAGPVVSNLPELGLRTIPEPLESEPIRDSSESNSPAPEFAEWQKTNVQTQRQRSSYVVQLPLRLGDIEAEKLAKLAEIVAHFGDGVLHAHQSQNLSLQWVSEAELPRLYAELRPLGLAEPTPAVLRNLVACAGASTCRLGLCQSRGLADALSERLSKSSLRLPLLDDTRIHISGCPNSCGRHPVADIGFFGAARRVNDVLVPHYTVQLGGGVHEGQARLGIPVATIPAKAVPEFTEELIRVWQEASDSSTFATFTRNKGAVVARRLSAKYLNQLDRVPPGADILRDWGSEEAFSLAGRGPAECSAGIFDLIEVDLENARAAVDNGRLYLATLLAARALLVTKGLQPQSDAAALDLFQEHFVEQGLVDSEFSALIDGAISNASTPKPERFFAANSGGVMKLIEAVKCLYGNLNSSLKFNIGTPDKARVDGI